MVAGDSGRLLQQALARMPGPLVSERARERLFTLSMATCQEVDLFYLEYRVSSDVADQVDVSVSAAAYAARAALAREVERLAESDPATWAPASRSLGRWCRRGTLEASTLDAACLEYDLPTEPSERRQSAPGTPALFFRAAELSHCRDLARTRGGLRQVLEWVAGERSRTLGEQLDAVLDALPREFHLAHLGFMFSRADETLRFDLALPGTELAAFLQRLGWPGTLAGCGEQLALAERGGWVTLAFGFGASAVTERLGIEVFPRGATGGAGLLAALMRLGCCTAAKAKALRALLDARPEHFRCELSHAKFVLGGPSAVETKLYVALAPNDPRLGRLQALRQIQARATPATRVALRCPAASG